MRQLALLCGLSVLLVSCAGKPPVAPDEPATQPIPRDEPLSARGNHSPYRVFGRTYRVLPSSRDYQARGVASWYGPKFHGRPTSSGEIFDMHQFTAAHRSLPLPTYARVTNLSNGRSVTVRINDRGPFKDNRLIDLSFAAARELDMINVGTTQVEVVALSSPDGGPGAQVIQTQGVFLQLGAFGQRQNALSLLRQLRQHNVDQAHIHSSSPADGDFVYRVRIGPLASADDADLLAAELVLLGFESHRVIFE
jgi:rare lipoprotein A